jgi:peptidoglycan/LPS O-acetylase OafA/YrhL
MCHMGSAKTQNPNLDILRSIAVLCVFCCHAIMVLRGSTHDFLPVQTWAIAAKQVFYWDMASLGYIGVLIFFVHTSLVLMESMERSGLTGAELIRNFYLRRAFRIYPLSISLIVIAVLFAIPTYPSTQYQWFGSRWFVANVLLIQNIFTGNSISSPLWSLPYEVQMYLVLPFLFLMTKHKNVRLLLAGIVYGIAVSMSIWWWRNHYYHSNDNNYYHATNNLLLRLTSVFYFAPCFLAGVMAYHLLGRIKPKLSAKFWVLAILAIPLVFATIPNNQWTWIHQTVLTAITSLLIVLFQRISGILAVGSHCVAKYSYGIYLSHVPVLWLICDKWHLKSVTGFVVTAIVTAVASIVSYHLLEHPMIVLGNRLANNNNRATTIDSLKVSVSSSEWGSPTRTL